jgi:hypothetical protein
MEKQLTYLFSELQKYPPTSYDVQVITKTLQTIFLQSHDTMNYLLILEDPEMLFAISAFFPEMIAQHKSRHYLDKLRMIIDRFKSSEHYPIILERYQAITDIFYGVFLIPEYNFSINKAVRDMTSIGLERQAKIILETKDITAGVWSRDGLAAARLTYIAAGEYYVPPKMVVVDFRAPDQLSKQYYNEHHYDWVAKDQRLFHGMALVKTEKKCEHTLLDVVAEFIKRNQDAYFLTSAGLAFDWRDIVYLNYMRDVDSLAENWDSVKLEIPEDFEIED